MATIDDVDEAEELRFLALKSMVKRSKQNNSNNESDDQDIRLLRAAALKTIAHKSNTQSNSLINNYDKSKKDQLINKPKKRNHVSPTRNKKFFRINDSKIDCNISSNTNIEKFVENKYPKDVKLEYPKDVKLEYPKDVKLEYPKDVKLEYPKDVKLEYPKEIKLEYPKEVKWERSKNNSLPEQKIKLEYNAESNNTPKTTYKDENNKDEVKKIVRNGSIQLSNLDSKKIDETMVLHITFSSSSESDDSSPENDNSSSDGDSIDRNIMLEKEILRNHINSGLIRSTDSKDNIVNHIKTELPQTLDDKKKKIDNCVQKLVGLINNCETEMQNRDEQLQIFLNAYKKYESHVESLKSIMQLIQDTRKEITFYKSESKIFEN